MWVKTVQRFNNSSRLLFSRKWLTNATAIVSQSGRVCCGGGRFFSGFRFAAAITPDSVPRTGVVTATSAHDSMLRTGEAAAPSTPDSVLGSREFSVSTALEPVPRSVDDAMMGVDVVIHGKLQAVLRNGLKLIIYNWDGDSAVQMVTLESSRRLFSFYKVKDGHLLRQPD